MTAYVNDTGGNLNSTNIVFRVDTTAPVFSDLENQTIYDNSSFSYSIDVADSGIGLGNFSVNDSSNFLINFSTGVLENTSILSAGNYVLNISINDSLGNLNWRLWKVIVQASTVEEEEEIVVVRGSSFSRNSDVTVKGLEQVAAGDKGFFEFAEKNIVEISISILFAVENPVVKVREIKISDVAEILPKFIKDNLVYGYQEISVVNIDDSSRGESFISFRIENSWLREKGVSKGEIVLQRFTEDWGVLETFFVREDLNYSYFGAITPGFSYFAITQRPEEMKESKIIFEEEGLNNQEGVEEERMQRSIIFFIGVLVVLVICFLFVFFFRKKKNPKVKKKKRLKK